MGREVHFSLPHPLQVPPGLLKSWAEIMTRTRLLILKTGNAQKEYLDRRRRDVNFKEGDLVLLSAKRLPGYQKLHNPWIGPFRILKRIGPVTYRLDTPEEWGAHTSFHVEYLKGAREGTTPPLPHLLVQPLPPEHRTPNDEDIPPYQILGISDRKFFKARGSVEAAWHYKAKIRGYRGRQVVIKTCWLSRRTIEDAGLGYKARNFDLEHPRRGILQADIDARPAWTDEEDSPDVEISASSPSLLEDQSVPPLETEEQ